MNEQQMTDVMERLNDHLQPDVAGLVAGGTARGRVRRRRRTAGSIVSGVAAVAAVGAIGYAIVPGDEGGSGTDEVSVASSPTPGTSDFGPAPEQTGEVLAERLREIVGGEVTEPQGWLPKDPPPSGPMQLGSVLLDGALVEVALWYGEAPECDERPPNGTCAVLPGGGLITAGTSERPEPDGGPSGVFSTAAGYYDDSGVVVAARVWNAADSDGAPALSTFPAVTEEQLIELVRDPVWLEGQQ